MAHADAQGNERCPLRQERRGSWPSQNAPQKKRARALPSDTVFDYAKRAEVARISAHTLNLIEQQKIRIGTCAWSFEEWSGPFFPPDLPQNRWLEWYARYFPSVEIDSTFYAAPAEEIARRWVEMTPAHFRFTCKLPREITHQRRLRDCRAELSAFLRALEPLAPKLRIVLIQLPPSYTPKEERTGLRNFVAQLPNDFRFAIEFRHPAWHRPHFIRLLEKHRICWVWSDTSPLNERNEAPFELRPLTTDFLYLRLLGDALTKYDGDGQRMHRYGKLLWKREAALDSWALRIQRHLAKVRSVWTFVNNHYEGFSPETCQRLAERLGFELALPAGGKELAPNDRGQLDLFADSHPV
jgi:uncharacterized protein YecE (DUF72 family)